MANQVKYKNFIPLKKFEYLNRNKMKRIKILILVLISINVYLFPLNVMKYLANEIKDSDKQVSTKEDVTIKMLSELKKYNIDKFNMQNNILNIEVDKETQNDIVEFLESKSFDLREIECKDEKVNIKVEI